VPQTNVIIEIRPTLLFILYNTKNIAYHIMEELTLQADKIMVMGNYKNCKNLMLAKYTCFTAVTGLPTILQICLT